MARNNSRRRGIAGWSATRLLGLRVKAILTVLVVGGASPTIAQGLAFASGRISSYSAHALYAGYFTGQTLVFGGVLQNPRTTYREALVGVGRRMNGSSAELIVGLAIANTSAGDYVQFYLLPSVRVGPANFSATVTAQAALDRGGTRDLTVYPGTLHFPLGERLALGTTWVFSGTLNQGASQSLGPSATYKVGGATLGLHLLRNITGLSNELWFTAWVTP